MFLSHLCAADAKVSVELYGEGDASDKAVTKAVPVHGKNKIAYVLKIPFISQEDIKSASVQTIKSIGSEGKTSPALRLDFTESGTDKNKSYTKAHVKEKIALVVNGEVYSEPTIVFPSGQSAVFTGQWTAEECDLLVKAINETHENK